MYCIRCLYHFIILKLFMLIHFYDYDFENTIGATIAGVISWQNWPFSKKHISKSRMISSMRDYFFLDFYKRQNAGFTAIVLRREIVFLHICVTLAAFLKSAGLAEMMISCEATYIFQWSAILICLSYIDNRASFRQYCTNIFKYLLGHSNFKCNLLGIGIAKWIS